MPTHTDVSKPDWERAEIARSAYEASQVDRSSLSVPESIRTRYAAPPQDTPFPLEYAYHLLGDVRGKVVLDFGCGNGENTILLASRGARVYSMDISRDSVEIARERLQVNGVQGDVEFFVASAHDLPMENESVDVLFGIAILHHLDLAATGKEVARVLKKGGRGIFQEPVRNSRMLQRIRDLIPYRAADVSPFERPLTEPELAAFAANFSGYATKAFWLPYVSVALLFPSAGRLIHPLCHFDGALLSKFPALRKYAGIRVLEVTK